MRAPSTALTSKLLPRTNPLQYLLHSCKTTEHLKQIHAHAIRAPPSPFHDSTASLLAAAYASPPHAYIPYAKALFRLLRDPTVFSWNSIVRGLSASDDPLETISYYRGMLRTGLRPNNYTFPSLIKACENSASLCCGTAVHAHVVSFGVGMDPFVQSTMICMYVENKCLDDARRVFDGCSEWDAVSWNTMIDGYIKCGELELARSVFDKMECHRDVVSWNTMINGYAVLGNLDDARTIFERIPCKNLVSWNSMMACHAKCGDVEGARRVFSDMPLRDVISWNSMLACYAQSGQSNDALALFGEMCRADVVPTETTMVSLLSACARLGALEQGQRLHAYIDTHKIDINTVIGTALLDMYAKCGDVARAGQIFQALKGKDLVAWNTMIAGMAVHGNAKEVLNLFDEMVVSGIPPDDITFVAVLSACSHAGMVDKGRQLFGCMGTRYRIYPKAEHYGCFIDLLSRAGLLEEALEFVRTMPVEPNAISWGALLGGCRMHGNVNVGEEVGRQLLSLQPKHSGRYALLSNIYATANRWDDAREVRIMMHTEGVTKEPGLSMV